VVLRVDKVLSTFVGLKFGIRTPERTGEEIRTTRRWKMIRVVAVFGNITANIS
jgi:hypothetical protein